MSGALACSSLAYSADTPQVVSQGGPLGAVSIGTQNLDNPNTTPATTAPTASNERDLLLKLQQQVQQLQGQLQQIKAQKNNNGSTQFKNTSSGDSSFTTYSSRVGTNNSNKSVNSTNPNSVLSKSMVNGDDKSNDVLRNIDANDSIISMTQKPLGGVFDEKGGIDVGGAPAITTGGQVTYLGAYSGNNNIPIAQISSSLFASTLLGQRDKFDDYSIFFGGFLETDSQVWFGSKIARPANDDGTPNTFSGNGQNIYLTSAKLYFLSNLGHYVTAQFDFDTDESSGFSLGNAFVMFGNLDTSPFFVTAGRNKLSVGAYGGGGTTTDGITTFLKPGDVTNVSLNYKTDTVNTNITVFGSDDEKANFSTGFFYANSISENVAVGFNTGYVFNMAGAGNSAITTALKNTGNTSDDVGAFNLDGNLTFTNLWGGGILNLGSGWTTTTKSEEFNGAGKGNAVAGAWYGAGNYSLALGGRDTNFGVSYGQSYNAAAIPMAIAASPINFGDSSSGVNHQLIFSAQRSYFDDNVIFGPEYVYQKLYNGSHMNTITLDMQVFL